jgi:hypothetical protein
MMFIDFEDLLKFASTGFVVTLFFALMGAFSLLVPVMMIVLAVAAVVCSRIE